VYFRITPIVKQLLIVNFAVYIAMMIFKSIGGYLVLGPTSYAHEFNIYQFITYQYVHDGFWHIFGNMLWLFFVGPIIEEMWGSKNFIITYTVAGIFSGILHMLFSNGHLLGASGSVYAIITAFALYYPNQQILIWGIFPVKVKYLFMFYLLTTFIGLMPSGPNDGVSHLAHLGGIIVGFVAVKFLFKSTNSYGGGSSDYSSSIDNILNKVKDQFQSTTSKKTNMSYKQTIPPKDANKLRHYRNVVDELLDKINQVGYLQLSDDERRRLEEASEYLKKYDS
jgi:membrane associated rhomboid family serine protease